MLANGNTYAGEYRKGVPHGEGTLTYSDGSAYIGDFTKGIKHGNYAVFIRWLAPCLPNCWAHCWAS